MNYYNEIYGRNVRSDKLHALKFCYNYEFINEPKLTPLLQECAWLKIRLIIAALDAGSDWVVSLDIDAEMKPEAPDFRSLFQEGKDLYMALGHSGRVNSGVMIVKNTPQSVRLFRTILSNAGVRLPKANWVGWGENGEVIHFTRGYPGLEVIDTRWNNNCHPELHDDYIRHYSAGPMRAHYQLTEAERTISQVAPDYKRTSTRFNKPGTPGFFNELEKLFEQATRHVAAFSGVTGSRRFRASV
jgi:hypothetical protein